MGEKAPISIRAMTILFETIAELDVRILAHFIIWTSAAQRKGRAWFLGEKGLYTKIFDYNGKIMSFM